MVQYIDTKVHIGDSQKAKIEKAVEDGTAVTIQFSHEDINGNDVIALTKTQVNKLAKAYQDGKGARIKLSATQLKHNKEMEGGFIGALLTGLASSVLPSVISYVADKFMGSSKGIAAGNSGSGYHLGSLGEGFYLGKFGKGGGPLYVKKGSGMVKVSQMGDGFYLGSYRGNKGRSLSDGYYYKGPNGLEPI